MTYEKTVFSPTWDDNGTKEHVTDIIHEFCSIPRVVWHQHFIDEILVFQCITQDLVCQVIFFIHQVKLKEIINVVHQVQFYMQD